MGTTQESSLRFKQLAAPSSEPAAVPLDVTWDFSPVSFLTLCKHIASPLSSKNFIAELDFV